MSQVVTINGTQYTLPTTGDTDWGNQFSVWAKAVSAAIGGGGQALHVSNYGAKGDGLADDTAAIQLAITAAQVAGLPLYWDNATYMVSDMPTAEHGENGLQMFGIGRPNDGSSQTTIIMRSPVMRRAVFSLNANYCTIEGIKFDANRCAKYAVFVKGSNFSVFRDCHFTRGTRAGLYFPRRTDDSDVNETLGTSEPAWAALTTYVSGMRVKNGGKAYEAINLTSGVSAASGGPSGTGANIADGTANWAYLAPGVATVNDSNVIETCWSRYNGTYYYSSGMRVPTGAVSSLQPGTVSWTAVSPSAIGTLTGSGTTFRSMGLRIGDFVCVGPDIADPATAQFFQVVSVTDDTHMSAMRHGTQPLADTTVSAQRYAVGVGGGYHEQYSGDNNINKIVGGLYRFNNGAGIIIGGLVGSSVEACTQVDYNIFYGIAVGAAANGQYTYSTKLTNPYLEANVVAHILISGAIGINIDTPEFGAGDFIQSYIYNNTSGFVSGVAGLGGAMITQLGNAFSDLECSNGAVSGNGGFTLNGELMAHPVNAGTLSAGVAVTTAGAIIGMPGAGGITFTGTPTLVSGRADGQIVRLRNDSTGNFVFQDGVIPTLAGTKLDLRGAANITITPRGTVQFSWVAAGGWWVLDWVK